MDQGITLRPSQICQTVLKGQVSIPLSIKPNCFTKDNGNSFRHGENQNFFHLFPVFPNHRKARLNLLCRMASRSYPHPRYMMIAIHRNGRGRSSCPIIPVFPGPTTTSFLLKLFFKSIRRVLRNPSNTHLHLSFVETSREQTSSSSFARPYKRQTADLADASGRPIFGRVSTGSAECWFVSRSLFDAGIGGRSDDAAN